LKKDQRYGEKEKRHQRHNLTVLSLLPVARSGAVGRNATEKTSLLCRARVATQVADELRKKWRRERALVPSLSASRTAHSPLKQSSRRASIAHTRPSVTNKSLLPEQTRLLIACNALAAKERL
jgi:hypothetical protein